MKRKYEPTAPSDFRPSVPGEADTELGIELELALEIIADTRQRTAFKLRLANCTYSEIAAEVGVSAKTIHQWLNETDGTVVGLLRGFFK